MTDEMFRTVKVTATGERRLDVEFAPGDDVQMPTIPAQLRGEDIPGFVLEWITEADEMGLIIQELLQAPTKSLCRIFEVPQGPSFQKLSFNTGSLGLTSSFNFTRTAFNPEVSGFGMPEAAPETVEGLPEGVHLPVRLLELIAMTKRLDVWLEKGRRVRSWAEEHGYGDAPWLSVEL